MEDLHTFWNNASRFAGYGGHSSDRQRVLQYAAEKLLEYSVDPVLDREFEKLRPDMHRLQRTFKGSDGKEFCIDYGPLAKIFPLLNGKLDQLKAEMEARGCQINHWFPELTVNELQTGKYVRFRTVDDLINAGFDELGISHVFSESLSSRLRLFAETGKFEPSPPEPIPQNPFDRPYNM